MPSLVGIRDIEAARDRIHASVLLSPCARSEWFAQRCDAITYFKLENLQRTGSFKERGALNRILALTPEERRRGIITASAGNHAQAVAYHASTQGIPATVVMPVRTPLVKVSNTRSYGARIILEGDTFDAAGAHARKLEQEEGLTFVHAFEDPRTIAGQGTVALELMEQAPELEVLIVPVGGGGLISGIATAYKARRREVRIVGVEAAAVPAVKRSLEAGRPVTCEGGETIADGIAVKRPGELTLAHIERYVDDMVTVDDEEIANAVLLLLEREKTLAEPAAATALAALDNGRVPAARGRHTAMVLSGGNIDVNLLSRIIDRGLTKDGRMIRLNVTIEDRPGALAGLLNLVGEVGANVLEIHHIRAFAPIGLEEVQVELVLETRGPEHVATLDRRLAERRYRVEQVEST